MKIEENNAQLMLDLLKIKPTKLKRETNMTIFLEARFYEGSNKIKHKKIMKIQTK